MKHTDVRAILDDYLGGTLGGSELCALEAHLAGCGPCRRELQVIRGLLSESAKLPPSIEPPRDLWPRIEPRLSAKPLSFSTVFHRFRPPLHLGSLAAAASVLVILAVSATVFATRTRFTHTENPVTAHQQFVVTEKYYVAASAELEEAFRVARNELSPETVQLIDKNLGVIDTAIQEIRDALAQDPNNRDVMAMLATVYQKKLMLLRDVTGLTSEL